MHIPYTLKQNLIFDNLKLQFYYPFVEFKKCLTFRVETKTKNLSVDPDFFV